MVRKTHSITDDDKAVALARRQAEHLLACRWHRVYTVQHEGPTTSASVLEKALLQVESFNRDLIIAQCGVRVQSLLAKESRTSQKRTAQQWMPSHCLRASKFSPGIFQFAFLDQPFFFLHICSRMLQVARCLMSGLNLEVLLLLLIEIIAWEVATIHRGGGGCII